MGLTRFHLHLVSDSTGDTVHSVARACLVQFDETQAIEHVWSMVRTRAQIERVVAGIEANPGVVLFTMVNEALRQILQDGCRRLQVPGIPVLDPVIGALGSYLGRESRGLPGKQHLLDNEYFARIDAMTFAINHDDGQSPWGINDADVCLVGVSAQTTSIPANACERPFLPQEYHTRRLRKMSTHTQQPSAVVSRRRRDEQALSATHIALGQQRR